MLSPSLLTSADPPNVVSVGEDGEPSGVLLSASSVIRAFNSSGLNSSFVFSFLKTILSSSILLLFLAISLQPSKTLSSNFDNNLARSSFSCFTRFCSKSPTLKLA